MKQTTVIDFFGIIRVVGYALALLAVAVFGVLWLGGYFLPGLRFAAPSMAGPIFTGLLVAWIAGLSRVLVRRMRFESPQV